ncbi:hypothetical protein FA15DRAFT_669811 [Coprinopsis marcescibilis]|uniref:HNH nuclease domain-containing protein n=1 Tax=Coprinopsis marcescibilis TaxID=230819 RepID=A0A5C3L7E5_COPMA|nr:hypothetical protein FA15DRAFT_669811 [Coprinopsis marcescibilis]
METFSDLGSAPESVIRRVLAVDPNNGRCLVENCSPNRGIEYHPVLPQKYWRNSSLLEALEWYWNMRKDGLNFETRRNMFAAGGAVHRMYAAGRWVLVPDEPIVQVYHGALLAAGLFATRETFPFIPDSDSFTYRLIPLQDMDDIAFIHQADTTLPPTPDAFTIHLHPFSTLPAFASHIHPKFVIVSAGLQLSRMKSDNRNALTATYPILTRILEVYLAWTCVPVDGKADPSYYPPYDPDTNTSDTDEGNGGDNHDGTATEKGRYSYPRKSKKARQGPPAPNRSRAANPVEAQHDAVDDESPASPSPASKRTNKKSSNLSRASVGEHTRLTIGESGWTKATLVDWSRDCRLPDLGGVGDGVVRQA